MEDLKQVETTEATPEVQETTEVKEQRTFTQNELDAIIQDRLSRERAKISKDLGINDTWDKEKYQEFLQYQESQKTELERAKEQAQKLEAEKLELLAERERITEEFAAAKLGIKPEALVDALALAKIKDGESIEDKLSKVLEEYPVFKMNNTTTAVKTIGSEKKDERPSSSQADSWLARKGLQK